jgi:hypothetical protein
VKPVSLGARRHLAERHAKGESEIDSALRYPDERQGSDALTGLIYVARTAN